MFTLKSSEIQDGTSLWSYIKQQHSYLDDEDNLLSTTSGA